MYGGLSLLYPPFWTGLSVTVFNFQFSPFRRHRSRVTRAGSPGRELRGSAPHFSAAAQLGAHPPGCHPVFIAPSLRNPSGMDCPDWTRAPPPPTLLHPATPPLKGALFEIIIIIKRKKKNTRQSLEVTRERKGLGPRSLRRSLTTRGILDFSGGCRRSRPPPRGERFGLAAVSQRADIKRQARVYAFKHIHARNAGCAASEDAVPLKWLKEAQQDPSEVYRLLTFFSLFFT